MRACGSALRKFSFLLSALIAGMCLFAAIAAARLENSLFDSELHKKLLDKYDIYSQTGCVLKTSLDEYLMTPDTSSPENLKQQEQLVSLIKKAIKPEMIRLNIDSISAGLLKYFKNKTRFLPDIYINPVHGKSPHELQTNTEKVGNVPGESLAEIDKINLSVLLMYMKRSDIIDKLSVIRLFQFALAKTPLLAGLLFAIALLSGLFIAKNKKELTGWAGITAVTAGCAFAASGASLLFYLYYVLPANHSFISLSVPLQDESAVSYMQNWLHPVILFLLIAGIAAIISGPLFKLLSRIVPGWKNIVRFIKSLPAKNGRIEIYGRKFSIKSAFAAISLLSIFLFSYLYFGHIKSEFLSYDLTVAVERMKGITAFSRVVYAQDAAVNTLELRMLDRKTNTPVQGIHTKITGRSAIDGNSYNEAVTSDYEGKSKATLDIGSFKLSFDSTQFPDEYKLPPPYLFEMEAAGSTVITISLDKVEEPKPGVIEIQVLGKDNLPLKSIELALENIETITETVPAGSVYSFTNLEGIAAFRTEAGTYRISFLANGFPTEYVLPSPMEINLDSDKTDKYSIKLAEKLTQSVVPDDKKANTQKSISNKTK
ncbi:MAG: EscU/YscU/HrcU family type III secretion system export apparatus switch protein [Ruminiclostridium sp.]|nr:EscU/YscU/HrcU family type III secretion system export apparatus switch protein [Ruminiclostridium sp.]